MARPNKLSPGCVAIVASNGYGTHYRRRFIVPPDVGDGTFGGALKPDALYAA